MDIDVEEIYNSIGGITYETDYNYHKKVMNYGTNCECWHKDFKNIKELLNLFINIDKNNDLSIYISNGVHSFSYNITITLTIDKQIHSVTYSIKQIKAPSMYDDWFVSFEQRQSGMKNLNKYANFKYKCMKRNELINEFLDI